MPSVMKRTVGYGAQGPRHVPRQRRGGVHREAAEAGSEREGDVATALRLVEASLQGRVHFVARLFATEASTAMNPKGLADSLAALVCGVASKCDRDRHIRITVTQTELGAGSASAAGVLPGEYVVFDIDDEPGAGRHAF